VSDIAVKIENLSKQYRLGVVGTQTLKGDLQRFWWNLRGKGDPTLKIGQENTLAKAGGEYVWALRDINLEIKKGEVLGIIGKNGAGKSTLLKILSRVTGPTTGSVKVNGRLASLLEVGTGFHPELTGKENIFLNGAILGMTKNDIRTKLDEIIDFAGVAKYVDTPVKRYSSGMYVRLGFAVAAFLEPEILVVDEVLAVGDAEFQKKAIGKMQDISSGGGRTVLFVSHNLNSVSLLCSSAILLENGKIIYSDNTDNVISKYIENKNILLGDNINLQDLPRKKTEIIFKELKFKNYPLKFGDNIEIILKLKSKNNQKFENIDIGIGIQDSKEKRLIHISNKFIKKELTHLSDDQEYHISIENILAPGVYNLTLFLQTADIIQDWLQDVVQFEIADGNPYQFMNTKIITGVIFPKFKMIQQ